MGGTLLSTLSVRLSVVCSICLTTLVLWAGVLGRQAIPATGEGVLTLMGKREPFDDELVWREEAFGERPILAPWGDPFHDDAPLECGLENPEVCESCQ